MHLQLRWQSRAASQAHKRPCQGLDSLQPACRHDGPEGCAPAGNALAAQGGFCAGPREMVDHQRLSGMGYCFSASLPPYLAVAATQALQALANKPQLVRRLQLNAASLRDALQDVPGAPPPWSRALACWCGSMLAGASPGCCTPHITLTSTASATQSQPHQLCQLTLAELQNAGVASSHQWQACLQGAKPYLVAQDVPQQSNTL